MDEETRRIERAFVAAVLADLADDAPRLVYADWLLDRKEELGELIVAQCLLEREGRAATRYRQARTQEHVILARNRTRWLKRAGIPVGRTRPHLDVTFRRGLITEAAFTMGEARSLTKRLALLPLEHLRLAPRGGQFTLGELRWLGAQPFAQGLKRLSLRIPRSDVTLDAQPAFAAARARQKTDGGVLWGGRFAEGFLHPHVLELVLDGSWPREFADFFGGFVLPPRLERLGIVDGQNLTIAQEGIFTRLLGDPHSRELASVSFARLSPDNARALFAAWPFTRAERLHLGLDEDAALLPLPGAFASLRSISTTRKVDRRTMTALARAPLEELAALGGIAEDATPLLDAPALHTLAVHGGSAPALLDMLEPPRALSSLRLEGVHLEDDDVRRLATMASLAGLFELHLASTGMSEESALALLEAPNLAEVPWIDLGETLGQSTILRRARIARSPAWSAGLKASLDP